MTDTAKEVYARLDEMGIRYKSMEHAPAHTIEDCLENDKRLGGVTAKNYFLTTKNQKNFYLCLVRPQARFRTSDISKQVGSSRLSFGSEEQMVELLHVHPGAVSPMGLLFDRENRVGLIVDAGLKDVENIAFHPCDNTQTLVMNSKDFFDRFLPAVQHPPRFVEIHDFM